MGKDDCSVLMTDTIACNLEKNILKLILRNKGFRVVTKWSRIFIELIDFSDFRESDKPLKHELGSV